jgi:lipopolysaccharide transport system permease protein
MKIGFLEALISIRVLTVYHNRLFEGVAQDIRQRYVGSALGSFWAFIFPITQLGIYAGLYSFIFKIQVPGLSQMDYVLLVFSGLVPLMAFNEALTAATSSLVSKKSLLLNTVFPAELIPLRAALSGHVTSLVGLVVTLILGFYLGRTGWEALIFVPIFWLFLLMFAVGLGWLFSLFSLVAQDFQHGLGLVVMLLFLLSPFAYTPDMVPEALRPIIYFNPLSYFVLTFQKIICYGALPDSIPAVGSILLGLGAFFFGFSMFQRVKYVFFDYA